jgi:Predicted O-linked N-acetylglucosamine transferase, SPINDLY family
MRGRHTYAILKMLNLEDLIATTKIEYVNIAVKLAKDFDFRNSIIDKIKNNKNKLFTDKKIIKFLENFFIDVTRNN